jgi:hypothetical protein
MEKSKMTKKHLKKLSVEELYLLVEEEFGVQGTNFRDAKAKKNDVITWVVTAVTSDMSENATSVFEDLSTEKEIEFEEWADNNHVAGEEINPLWHPVVRRRCAEIDRVALQQSTGDVEDLTGTQKDEKPEAKEVVFPEGSIALSDVPEKAIYTYVGQKKKWQVTKKYVADNGKPHVCVEPVIPTKNDQPYDLVNKNHVGAPVFIVTE